MEFWEICLTVTLLLSISFTIILITLPTRYNPFQPLQITNQDFIENDQNAATTSGYEYYKTHQNQDGTLTCETSVQVVVLGDIGRSPRMQYHAISLAERGSRVFVVGYLESDVHPDLARNRFVTIVPIAPSPTFLITKNRLTFLLLAPIKVAWQIWSLYRALTYRTPPCQYILVQNPPSIPTLAIAQGAAFLRKSRLVIDWHNFGYTILALRLGNEHFLVKFSQWYEGFFSQAAAAHFCVTNAMARVLKEKWGVEALPLHDRPPKHFQPLSSAERSRALKRIHETSAAADAITGQTTRLLVSSTSWTADEDFQVLLDALVAYSTYIERHSELKLPRLLTMITGKGPQKAFYLDKIASLRAAGRLSGVEIATAWLTTEDYASLLGCADLGISLHTSSSGVDLPMKVVDMFGTGLPVAGWSDFEAWSELVTEGIDGRGFKSSDGLTQILVDVFANSGAELEILRQGALKACERRWDDEWLPVAGTLFRLQKQPTLMASGKQSTQVGETSYLAQDRVNLLHRWHRRPSRAIDTPSLPTTP